MSEHIQDSVEREITIEAAIQDVFEGLTNPARFPSWGPQNIEGILTQGSVVILDFGPSGGGRVAVYVEEFSVPTKFAFRWAQGHTDPVVLLEDPRVRPSTLVTFSLESSEEGTVVKVVESGFIALMEGSDSIQGTELGHVGTGHVGAGWTLMLSGLARSFGLAGTPVSDSLENEKTVPVSAAIVYDYLINPEKWWAAAVEGTVAVGETPILDFGQFGRWRIYVENARPNEYFAFRRVLGTDDAEKLVQDPRTTTSALVEFWLTEVGAGTMLRHRESGYDTLPDDLQEMHFLRWQQGWSMVLGLLEMHLGPR